MQHADSAPEPDEPFVSTPTPDELRTAVITDKDHRRALDESGQLWADEEPARRLLKVFTPRITIAAMQVHHLKNKGRLHMGMLTGICRAMHRGEWEIPPDTPTLRAAAGSGSVTPMPAYIDTTSEDYRQFEATYHRKAN